MEDVKPSGRGGARPGAGRKRRPSTRQSQEAIARAAETGELPHEFLLRIARGEPIDQKVKGANGEIVMTQITPSFDDRRDAAKAAAPYFAAKLSNIEVVKGMNDDELDESIRRLAAQAGIDLSADGEGGEEEEA